MDLELGQVLERGGEGHGGRDPRSLPVSVVGLPRDVVDSLAVAGVVTLGDFAKLDARAVVEIRGVGTGSIRRVRRWLELQGFSEILSEEAPTFSGLHVKKNVPKLTGSVPAQVLPVPESLVQAAIPHHAIPARISNLLRRHGLKTLGELYLVLQKKTNLEGFGVGTRMEVVESLPGIYAAAIQANKNPEEQVPGESLERVVQRLRSSVGRPVQLSWIARELSISDSEAASRSRESSEIVFIDPWCLTPDGRGLLDAISVLQAGELGEALSHEISRNLSEREFQVLERWVGLGRPNLRHGQIAKDMERSRERIRQLRQRALMKVASSSAVRGMLSAMTEIAVRGISAPYEVEVFLASFEKKFGLLLGTDRVSGFARLCLRGFVGKS